MVCLRVRLHRCGAHEALEGRNVLHVDWAHVNRLSSELCVDWATLLSVSATSIGASSKACTKASPEASPA